MSKYLRGSGSVDVGTMWNLKVSNQETRLPLYSLKVNETFFGRIQKDDWNKQVKITNNIIIVERSEYNSIQYEEFLIFYMTLIFLNILIYR